MIRPSFLAAALVAAVSPTALCAPADPPPGAGTATPTTLTEGQLWIRAVESPNFHKYLQTKPPNVPGTAILDSYTTAGQFNIVGGQLVNSIANPPLYMWVDQPADPANPPRTLATWFNTTKNPFGTFEFSGDTVTWSDPSVKRQNLAAWLVCAKQQLFVNTGAYAYETPSGCADETVSLVYSGLTIWEPRP
ncbi:hypothetical protein QBC33DRAFT_548756 [Phialemonium atrogriseum]|uniref:Uncharacterized protein n=1 Tax=Phialemonium atrogriseum TaxID=1093897 RepID=A0AAJ0FE25_9PEZI|nr:uncharacterized protein QBC33DRAFT_548756 [Phialemonium atrogriseum]KAK1763857.1 hypothetical protein QBC33DRAFT_548756 [Phialemonium atrogriseum]